MSNTIENVQQIIKKTGLFDDKTIKTIRYSEVHVCSLCEKMRSCRKSK